jgi:rfaE bifunctional protein kinase chain/domain
MHEISRIIENVFPTKRVLIVGDLVADQFLHGTISRVSREAPVFILRHDSTLTVPGAAANAAANVASLGGVPVLAGVIGSDPNGKLLINALNATGVTTDAIVTDQSRATTTKVRVLAGQHYAARQQVIRIDYEAAQELSANVREMLHANIFREIAGCDAVVVSDYHYGVVGVELFAEIRSAASSRGVPLIVDSRYRLADYYGATTATPNREEVEQILGRDFSADDCFMLRERLGLNGLLVTNGNKGMTFFGENENLVTIDPFGPTEPVDVTGAGDTVIAAYALGLASGLSFVESATLANQAGGLVVMKKGTACVTAEEMLSSLAMSIHSTSAG